MIIVPVGLQVPHGIDASCRSNYKTQFKRITLLQSLFSSILWNYFMINYHRVLETDQYWGDVNYLGVVEAQGSILRSSSMWMVSESAFFTIEVTQYSIRNSCDVFLCP